MIFVNGESEGRVSLNFLSDKDSTYCLFLNFVISASNSSEKKHNSGHFGTKTSRQENSLSVRNIRVWKYIVGHVRYIPLHLFTVRGFDISNYEFFN